MPCASSLRWERAAAAGPVRSRSRHPRLLADEHDALRLGAFRALRGLELHLRVLGERLVALADDRAVMDEQILAALIGDDEAVPLLVVEPLHGSGCHI